MSGVKITEAPQGLTVAGLKAALADARGEGEAESGAVKVTVDDGKPISMAAWRPKTDEAIALFITELAPRRLRSSSTCAARSFRLRGPRRWRRPARR